MVDANSLMSDPVGPSATSGNALKLTWSFGFQKDLVGGVHSLSTASRRAVFYPAAHTGVIYDYARRQQTLLQGHCHLISCCVVSEDKRWIVTADKGPESMLVVWDAATGNPIKTIFRPHPLGVEAIDMSPDALFIVTLSAVDRGDEGGKSSTNSSKRKRFDQELSVWEWTSATNSNKALHSSYVATEDVQHSVRFNTYDVREIVTNGRQRVIFWSWASHKLLFYSPSLSQRDFRQVVGNFTQSLFVPDSTQALTGTEDGDLVLWDIVASVPDDGAPAVASLAQVPDRKAVKIVRLGNSNSTDHKNGAALTVLTDMDGYLVLGSSDGAVRFFDFDFRLVAWFEDMNAGAVTSVSFACVDDEEDTDQKGEDDDNFSVPDFVVGTASAFIVGMNASLFGEHEPEKRRGTLLMQGINDAIHGLAAHPRLPQLALSSYSGVVQLWDYVGKRLIMMRRFDPERGFRPQCLAFSPDGRRLFIGFTSGAIKIVHAQRLDDMASFRLGKAAITDVRVSPDSALFVALDANLYMGMWRCKPGSSVAEDDLTSPTGGDEWVYIGRCRAHSKPVTGLEFAWDGEGNLALVSVAEDRTMVEYALDRCSVLDGIVLKQAPTRIEQSGAPTACCWHPELRGLQEDLVVVANDEYKLKQWNASNKTCRKTTLGPCYGGPINKLVPVPLKRNASFGIEGDDGGDVSERYCAYSTHEKVVGLLKLPLDGNPHKAMGLIAHPGAISNVDVTFDGTYLLTAGVEDLVVNMWEIHTSQLDILEASLMSENSTEAAADREALALAPYLSLLEGGADGSFYHEIVDYFYLAQLRVQGEESMAVRDISGRIPLREIPNVMRAIGFYPTDQEIQHMCSEVKFSKFTQTSQAVESLDLNEFIKLYVNHRPVFGVGKAHIERAFEVLAKKAQQQRNTSTTDLNGAPVLSWDLLEARLLHSGEAMTEDELHSCLKALVVSADGTKSGVAAMDREYSALKFADKVLGFDDYEEESETQEEAASGL